MTEDNKTPDEANVEPTPATPDTGSDASGHGPAPESSDNVIDRDGDSDGDGDGELSTEEPSEPEADTHPEPIAAVTPEERARSRRSPNAGVPADSRPVRAVAKYLRFSAQKGRLVVDQIRGKRVIDAATALAFSDRDAAREIIKVLKSAVSNAENNHGMSVQDLYVSAAFVDEGPTFKRFKPRARGRADRINKRTCHVTVIVDNAPATLREGRGGSKTAAGSRSARVAASKTPRAQGPVKKDGRTTRKSKANASEQTTAAGSAATTKGDS